MASILYNVRCTDHESNMASFCTMSDAQITSPTWRHSVQCQMHRSRVQHGVILYNVRCTDHESNMASFCTMSDTQITSPTWHHSVNVRYTDHESNMKPFCIMSDTQIMSPTWHHSVNVRYTDHESKCIRHYTEWCWTRDLCIWHYTEWCWTCDLCIWHYTEWIHVGHVICVSDIIQNGFMLALWSCIWHYTEWCHVGLMICLSNIIQNDATLDSWSVYLTLYRDDATLDSWSVYLTLYRMTQCWTRDLVASSLYNVRYTDHESNIASSCIMSDTQITSPSVSDIIQNDGMLDLWSVYLTLYRMMMDSWSVYLPLYRMTTCWTRDLCIWHYTEWRHVGLMICVSDIIQNGFMLDSWSHVVILYNGRYTDHESTWSHSV